MYCLFFFSLIIKEAKEIERSTEQSSFEGEKKIQGGMRKTAAENREGKRKSVPK
jgi:hypothetical protein